MIRVLGDPEPPVPRLMEVLRARGHAVDTASADEPTGDAAAEPTILVLGPGSDPGCLRPYAGSPATDAPPIRLLVLSLVGTHPDARAPLLQSLWSLEEKARATGLAVLTLRLAPLLGPTSPLWLKLRRRPALPRGGRKLLNPVLETDVVATLEHAILGRARWEGWYELAGAEAVTLGELATWARAAGPATDPGAWEPPIDVLEDQKLCDPGPWRDHFGIAPARIDASTVGWAA